LSLAGAVGVVAAEPVAATVSTSAPAAAAVADDADDGDLPISGGFTPSLRGLTAGAGLLTPDDDAMPDDVIGAPVACSPVNE